MRRSGPILRLADDVYVEWSSVCDAPTSVYTRAEVEAMLDAYVADAEQALREARDAIVRLDTNGHTMIEPYWQAIPVTSIVAGNRAGPDESRLSFDELVTHVRAVLAGRGEP